MAALMTKPKLKVKQPKQKPTFADRIRALMEEQEMTGRDLAKKAKLSYYTVSSYLMSKRDPSVLYLVRIAKALGVSIEAFSDCTSSRPNYNRTGVPGRPRTTD